MARQPRRLALGAPADVPIGEARGHGRVGIQLTGDHPVLTERGYVPVADLLPARPDGDRPGPERAGVRRRVRSVLGDSSLRSASAILTCSHRERRPNTRASRRRCSRSSTRSSTSERRSPSAAASATYAVVQYKDARGSVAARVAPRVLRRAQDRPRVDGDQAQRAHAGVLVHGRRPHARASAAAAGAEIATNGSRTRDRRVLLEGLLRLGLRAKAMPRPPALRRRGDPAPVSA